MRTVEFDLISTLIVSIGVYFLGRFLIGSIPVHPAVTRYFGTPAPTSPGAPGAQPKGPASPGAKPKG